AFVREAHFLEVRPGGPAQHAAKASQGRPKRLVSAADETPDPGEHRVLRANTLRPPPPRPRVPGHQGAKAGDADPLVRWITGRRHGSARGACRTSSRPPPRAGRPRRPR